MTVEQKIRSIVDDMEGVSYVFDDWSRVNLKMDKLKLPAVINILPPSGTLEYSKGVFKDAPNCAIGFADIAQLDFDGAENDATIDRCKSMAMEFIARVNNSKFFEPLQDLIHYSVFYNKLNRNITGIIIELSLKENVGVCVPYNPKYKEIFEKWRKLLK